MRRVPHHAHHAGAASRVAPSAAAPSTAMDVGATVLLDGLVARPKLNGQRGTVIKAADPTSGRYGVRLDDGSKILLSLGKKLDFEQAAAHVPPQGLEP